MNKSFQYDISDIKAFKALTTSADMIFESYDGEKIIAEVATGESHYEPAVEILGHTLKIHFQRAKRLGLFKETGLGESLGIGFLKGKSVDKVKIKLPKTITDLEVATASGDVILENLDLKNLVSSMASGDFKALSTTIGVMKCNTASGDLRFENFNYRQGKLNTASGDVVIKGLKAIDRQTKINTVSGDIHMLYGEKPALEIRVSSVSGDVSGNIPLFKKGKKYFTTSEDEANDFLEVNTVSGDIGIKVKEGKVMTREPLNVQNATVSSNAVSQEIDESILDEETKKILSLYREGKLTPEYAKEMLDLIGYSDSEIETLLKREPSDGGVKE